MDPTTLAAAAAASYLLGSVSGARLAARRAGRADALAAARRGDGAAGAPASVTGIGAGSASIALGARTGLLVAAFDIAKGALAVLAAGALVPGAPAPFLAGLAVVAGHVYPLLHGFRGGRGLSPMVGTLLVLEPIGLAVALVAGTLLAILIDRPYTALALWFPVLAAWPVLVRGDLATAAYALGLLALFLLAALPEIRVLRAYRRGGRGGEFGAMVQDSTPQMRMMGRLATRVRRRERSSAERGPSPSAARERGPDATGTGGGADA